MVTRLFLGLAATALLLGGCGLEEPPPRYPHQCYQTASCRIRTPVVVQVKTPPPAPSRAPRAQCPAGTYWHPGKPYWNGRQWVQRRGRCVRVPVAYRHRRRCVFVRGRWVRTWRGWRAVRGRWVCRR